MKQAPFNIGQIVILVGSVIAGLYFLRNIVLPLVVAVVLTILVNALVRWIVRRWPAAPRWAVMTLAGTIISLALAGGMYVLAEGAVTAIRRGPELAARVDLLVESGGRLLGLTAPVHLNDLIGDLSIAKMAGSILLSAQEAVTGVVLTIVYFGFMLASRAKVAPRIRHIAASSDRAAAIHTGIARIEAHVETYIWVQTVTGLILALASSAVMMAFGLENAVFWTITLFLLSFIPTLGVTIGSVVVLLFALVQFPTGWQGVAIFGGIQAIAFIVGNLIYPRFQARTQNIDPVAVILALSFWTFLWGVPGAFLAVPLTLILMMICAQSPSTRWVAVLLSNDGMPSPPFAGPAEVSDDTR